MKHILSLILTILMTVSCVQFTFIGADDTHAFWATVSNGNSHLLPADYEKAIKNFARGKFTEERSYSDWAWKNDYVNSRIDFLTLDTAYEDVTLVTEDLVSKNGDKISKDNITATYLQKVDTLSKAYPGIDDEIFDIITHKNVKDLAAKEIHEAWVQMYIPKDAEAGTYTTTVSLKSGNKVLVSFDYSVEVVDLTLTDPGDWETYLELWTTPHASNRYYSGKTVTEYFGINPNDHSTNPYSYYNVYLNRDYEAGMISELEMYAKAGGDVITVFLVEGIDNSREPCPCASMVKIKKNKQGKFEYDFSDMDYWIELNMACGIDTQINLHGFTGVGYGIVYYDETTKTMKHENGNPGDATWNRLFGSYMEALVPHLEEKGWFDITALQMDERTLEQTKALINIAKKYPNSEGKTLMITGAVNDLKLQEIFDDMHDISIWEVSLPENIRELAKERREKGLMTTVYSCGAGKMASPCDPGEAAYAVYDSIKYNTDGVLRWALNKYDEDPIYGELHTVTYPGDCYLIYPDELDGNMQAQSTPRFEKLCEGMRNTEKIRILRKSYPQFENAIQNLIDSIGKNTMVDETARISARILAMSRAAVAAEKNTYTDIKNGAWYEEAVSFALINGFMNGVAADRFDPNGSMTRAMFVTVLARMDGEPLDNNATSVFKDVPSGQWYTGAIAWATKSGLLYGVGDGKFDPNGVLTREQTATLLFRYATREKLDVEPRADLSGYKDYKKVGSYALDAMSWANAKGIVKGVSATSLDPRGKCTRAQVSQMFMTFCRNVKAQ